MLCGALFAVKLEGEWLGATITMLLQSLCQTRYVRIAFRVRVRVRAGMGQG
jgi:hypothetical protein